VKPTWKTDEIDLFIRVNTPEDVAVWLQDHGVEI